MKTVYYLHGFASSHLNGTRLDVFDKTMYKLVYVEYNPHNYNESMNILDELFSNVDPENTLVIGCSFGGYWVDYVSQIYKLEAISINPVINPSTSIIMGTYFNHADINNPIVISEPLQHSKLPRLENSRLTVILNMNDEVIDYKIANAHYKSVGVKIYKSHTGKHRCSNWPAIYRLLSTNK